MCMTWSREALLDVEQLFLDIMTLTWWYTLKVRLLGCENRLFLWPIM